MTLGVQQLPYQLEGTDWDAEKERWADSVLEDLFVFAPNLRDHILVSLNGQFQGAATSFESALSEWRQLGSRVTVAGTQLRIAALLIEEGRAPEALSSIDAALDALRKEGSYLEPHALAVKARALLAGGDLRAAESAVQEARRLVAKSSYPAVRHSVSIAEAEVDVAAGRRTEAQPQKRRHGRHRALIAAGVYCFSNDMVASVENLR